MRKLFALSLALIISLFGAMELSNIPQGLTVVKNVFSERTSDMTSCDNGTEIDGICFETLLPEKNYRLPKSGKESPIEVGIRITNNSLIPHRFELPKSQPRFFDNNGEPMQVDFARNATRRTQESDIPLIEPGKSLDYFIDLKFVWTKKDCIQLQGITSYGGILRFWNFKPGKYKMRFTYFNLQQTRWIYTKEANDHNIYNDFWTGNIYTNPVSLILN